jgi:hypothetical protein
VIRTEAVTEIPLRFYSCHLRFLSCVCRGLTSVAILVGDSTDETHAEARQRLEALRGQGYRRLLLLSRNFGYQLQGETRHKHVHQLAR